MLAVGVAVAAVLAFVLVAYLRGGHHPLHYLDDPASVANISPLAGALSVVGVLLWFVAGTAALLAAPHAASLGERSLLRAVGVVSVVLALDDQFMVHEVLVPETFGVSELGTIIPYAIVGIVLAVWLWRAVVDHPDSFVLIVALTCLGVSLAIDVTHEAFAGATAEEAAKLFGIAFWTLFAVRAHRRAVPSRSRADLTTRSPTTEATHRPR